MKRLLSAVLMLCGVGCTTPHNYKDPIDASMVTVAQLDAHAETVENHYQQYNVVEGIMWERYRAKPEDPEPSFFGNGGDSCIFTGHKLAADIFRYQTTKLSSDLDKVEQSLRGLYILTHITGTSGAICRNAFPLSRAAEWRYPDSWAGRDQRFVHTSSSILYDPFTGGNLPEMVYYTRATKDQLTGLVFGLTVAWKYLSIPEGSDLETQKKITRARALIAQITEGIYNHLHEYDWQIRDENGDNDTNADNVKGMMRTMVLALYRRTAVLTSPERVAEVTDEYKDSLAYAVRDPGDLFNRFSNYTQYFAWNLRYLRVYSIILLEDNADNIARLRDYMQDRLWQFTKGHYNSKFIYLYNAANDSREHLDEAYLALQSLSLKPLRSQDSPLAGDDRSPSFLQVLVGDWDRFVLLPHLRKPTSYSTWQKAPWDTGNPGQSGIEETIGVDYMLTYWMRRFYGF